MQKRHRKALIAVGKGFVAACLVVWVLSKAFWHDYVTTADGEDFAVASVEPSWRAPERMTLQRGVLWWRTSRTMNVAARQGGLLLTDPQGGADLRLRPVTDNEDRPILDAQGRPLYRRPGFAASMANLKMGLLVAAAAGFLVCFIISGVRWWFLLRVQDIHVSLWETIRLTFVGLFFNTIVPGTVGGDLIKAYYVCKHTHRKAAVLMSIFVDRLLGLTELTLLAGMMLLLVLATGWESLDRVASSAITVAVVVGVVVLATGLLLSERLRRVLHLQKLYRRLPIAHHIEAAGDAANMYRRRLPALLKAIAMTFGAHLFWVGSIALIGFSLNLGANWYSYFLYVPLIYIIGAVPIAPGGVGLVEKLYVVFFASVNPSGVLALALLARLVPIFWSLPGLYFAMRGPKLPKTSVIEQELQAEEQAEAAVGR